MIEIGYWGIRGLAAPLRAMLMYHGTPFISTNYDLLDKPDDAFGFQAPAWFMDRKPAMKEINPLANLPFLVDGDVIISQSNACLMYLGRKLGEPRPPLPLKEIC